MWGLLPNRISVRISCLSQFSRNLGYPQLIFQLHLHLASLQRAQQLNFERIWRQKWMLRTKEILRVSEGCSIWHIPVCHWFVYPLQWRHNGHDGVSNHQPDECLLNRLFSHRSKKYQSSASLAFVRGIHRWSVNSPHKGPVTRKMFPFHNVIMWTVNQDMNPNGSKTFCPAGCNGNHYYLCPILGLLTN